MNLCPPGPDPGTTTDEPNHSVTSDQGLIGSSYSTVRCEFPEAFSCSLYLLWSSTHHSVWFYRLSVRCLCVLAAVKQPPAIISPLNGTIFESPYGEWQTRYVSHISSFVLKCKFINKWVDLTSDLIQVQDWSCFAQCSLNVKRQIPQWSRGWSTTNQWRRRTLKGEFCRREGSKCSFVLIDISCQWPEHKKDK